MTQPHESIETLPAAGEIAHLPADGGPRFNALIHEISPYLLQHCRNPVNWLPWGEEAFEKARRENKPMFVSVGYASCHWCHVMAHESFEDDDIADMLNEHFVPVKVDREQRPDVDHLLMLTTQMMTGSGGWPNSVWCTPEGKPWLAGTYFPPEDRGGRPGFKSLLHKTAEMWKGRHSDVVDSAGAIAQRVAQVASAEHLIDPAASPLTLDDLDAALQTIQSRFDEANGGFGTAPKFPPCGAMELILRLSRLREDAGPLTMVTRTLDAMADGGIRDHLAGGFHRYSTDDHWRLPHFEKMLYDNARLASIYADAARATGNDRYGEIAEETCDWVLAELADPSGAFRSALDADSEQQEGAYYQWTHEDITAALGDQADLFIRAYGIVEEGNVRDEATGRTTGLNVLYRAVSTEELAREEACSQEDIDTRLAAARDALRAKRGERTAPAVDDKVLTAWNGLMIGALAKVGTQRNREDFIEAARNAARLIRDELTDQDGRISRVFRRGRSEGPAFLDDHAYLARGMLALHAVDGDAMWLSEAQRLTDAMLTRYADGADAEEGFFLSGDDADPLLFARVKDPTDSALPSANGVAVSVLANLASRTGQTTYLQAARNVLGVFAGLARQAPQGACALLVGLIDAEESAAQQ
jgi:uncharacterized protein